MDTLDLDIQNYNIKEIEQFFRFKPNSGYTASDVEYREYEIREQLLVSGHINKRYKRDLLEFLTTAKDWLILVKCTKPLPPTSIPKNYQLDTLDTPLSKQPTARTEEIITRQDTPFIHSMQSDFFPGTLNPLTTRIITKCLNIDTKFRDNLYTTQSSDFILNLPEKYNKVVSMQLSSLEFPVTFYGISSYYGNNYLYLSMTYTAMDVNGATVTDVATNTFIMPDGNYNSIDFIQGLNTIIQEQSGVDQSTTNRTSMFKYIELLLDINSTGSGSGKVTIYSKNANIQTITMDFTRDSSGNVDSVPVASRIGWNLGFLKPTYTGADSYTADTVIEPALIRYAFLCVDDFTNSSNNHFVSVFEKSILAPNILARFSMRASYFSLMMETDYKVVTEPRRYFGPVDIQRLRIRVYDDFGRILAMNNANYSFSIILKILYDV
jgi:hypothetical protein